MWPNRSCESRFGHLSLHKVAKSISGRKREQQLLQEVASSDRAEFVAVYGRRRVGKTFLVREFFEDRASVFLEVTGTKDGPAGLQRRRFREAVEHSFAIDYPLPEFANWNDALAFLTSTIVRRAERRPGEAIVVFFDELPWLATPRSGLLEAIDYYWNRTLSRLAEVKLIVCGSAASWMLRRIVDAKGGLHNRLTRSLRLDPFSLAETRDYLRGRRMKHGLTELFRLYMALGGVPYYLSLVKRGESVAQSIGRLCFEHGGPLQREFEVSFASLFDGHESHIAILRALAQKQTGMTRDEIIEATKLGSGGSLNRRLDELEQSGFVARVQPYGRRTKSTSFRLIDEFTIFHLRWIEAAPRGVLARGGTKHWQAVARTPGFSAWSGYAFESICLKHAAELERALGIDGLVVARGAWRHVAPRGRPAREGAQVDLLFDRSDGVINLCELKFSQAPYVVTKAYASDLRHKIEIFERRTKTRKRCVLTLVSPFGLKPNTWSEDLVEVVVDGEMMLG